MRKREWQRCKDPAEMLWVVHRRNGRQARLLTLFAGRRLWTLVEHEVFRIALEFAWSQAEVKTLAEDEVERKFESLRPIYDDAIGAGHWMVADIIDTLAVLFRHPASAAFQLFTGIHKKQDPPLLSRSEMDACCGLMREIFGDRGEPVTIDPGWLMWNDGVVKSLAQSIYSESHFEHMPILGDALEDAGCANADILAHCRANTVEHLRGCWVLDAILGKS